MTRGWTTGDILATSSLRRRGYAHAVFSRAKLHDGRWVLSKKDFQFIRKHYAPVLGLGDLLWLVIHPVARFIDRFAETNLQICKACSRRRAWLNRAFPFPQCRVKFKQ